MHLTIQTHPDRESALCINKAEMSYLNPAVYRAMVLFLRWLKDNLLASEGWLPPHSSGCSRHLVDPWTRPKSSGVPFSAEPLCWRKLQFYRFAFFCIKNEISTYSIFEDVRCLITPIKHSKLLNIVLIRRHWTMKIYSTYTPKYICTLNIYILNIYLYYIHTEYIPGCISCYLQFCIKLN